MRKTTEVLTATFLGLVLLISVGNEFVAERISNNLQNQIQQDLDLSKAYGETNALYLEVNQLLYRNLFLALEGQTNKTVEETGIFKRENFTESKWKHWRSKPTIEFWEHSYYKVLDRWKKSIDATNEKRHKQENFVRKNSEWLLLESGLRILQIGLIILTLMLYTKSILSQTKKNPK